MGVIAMDNGEFRHMGSGERSVADDETWAALEESFAHGDHLKLLRDVTDALAVNVDLFDLVNALSSVVRRAIPHAFMALALHEAGSDALVLQAASFRWADGCQDGDHYLGTRLPVLASPSGCAFRARRTLVFHDDDLSRFGEVPAPLRQRGIRTLCCVPLLLRDLALGTLEIGSLDADAFTRGAVVLIDAVACQVAMAVANALAFREIAQLRSELGEEHLPLDGDVPVEHPFKGVVGASRALRAALQQVEIVAPTDSTVLVLGETGTGKELIARAIHERSSRRERAFAKINCAAIPAGLLESELFGHERGAFTGAIAQRIGHFEAANGGTLFLDEIGEIPLELQPKLLRVLQDWEFARIGGTRTIRADVRLVAATNRDLVQMVEEHRFRSDLYYRLNVFPINAPPLRERPEDIEPLVRHFVERFAARMKRRIDVVSTKTMDALRRYSWPGNVRELENLIERAVILSTGTRLTVPLEGLANHSAPTPDGNVSTLKGIERAHIARVLGETNGVVSGPAGAAVRLGVKRTTLEGMIKRLGIATVRGRGKPRLTGHELLRTS
jgi:formate hydrogenlyase transcriptional activator